MPNKGLLLAMALTLLSACDSSQPPATVTPAAPAAQQPQARLRARSDATAGRVSEDFAARTGCGTQRVTPNAKLTM